MSLERMRHDPQMSAYEEVDVSNLTVAEREAVQEAVEAVVNRDIERVRELLSEADRENAADFWIWANDYGRHGRLTLANAPRSYRGMGDQRRHRRDRLRPRRFNVGDDRPDGPDTPG